MHTMVSGTIELHAEAEGIHAYDMITVSFHFSGNFFDNHNNTFESLAS